MRKAWPLLFLGLSLFLLPPAFSQTDPICPKSFARLAPNASPEATRYEIDRINATYESLFQSPVEVKATKLRVLQLAVQEQWMKRSASGKGYRTIPMQKEYLGEHKKGGLVWTDDPRPVRYFTAAERERFEVIVDKEGLLRDRRGRLINNCNSAEVGTAKFACSDGIFVMSGDGKIYIYTGGAPDNFAIQHSSLMAGMPVAAAGGIRVSGGKIFTLNRRSGHYLPPEAEFLQVVTELKLRGANLSETKVNTYIKGQKP